MTQEIRKDKKEDQANLGKKYVQNNKIHSGKWKVQKACTHPRQVYKSSLLIKKYQLIYLQVQSLILNVYDISCHMKKVGINLPINEYFLSSF
jgi:hypothetical protein